VKRSSTGAPVLPAPQLAGQADKLRHIQLTWSKVPDAEGYVLERATFNAPFMEVYSGPDRSFSERGVNDPQLEKRRTATMTWYYRVRASAGGQAGKWSDVLRLDQPLWFGTTGIVPPAQTS